MRTVIQIHLLEMTFEAPSEICDKVFDDFDGKDADPRPLTCLSMRHTRR